MKTNNNENVKRHRNKRRQLGYKRLDLWVPDEDIASRIRLYKNSLVNYQKLQTALTLI